MLNFPFDRLLALLPASLGQKVKSLSLAVTIASDQDIATGAKQDDQQTALDSIDGKVLNCDTTDVTITSLPSVTVGTCALPTGAATAAKQDTVIAGLSSIDGHVDGLEASCSSIDGKITACNTGAVVVSSSALPTGAATSTKQSDGTQKTQVVDGSGNVQPSGDTAARPIWAKLSDGAAALFDAAVRAGFVKLTDGTNTAAVKAASTAAAATDPAIVVALSPNLGVVQGAPAAAGAPWAVRQSDGSAFYTGAKTGQLPSALGTAVMSASLPVTFATDDAAVKALTPQGSCTTLAEVTTGANTTAAALNSMAATHGVIVQAHPTNTINVRIGDSNTSSTRGIALTPGKAIFLPVTNANQITYCNESSVASKIEALAI
jgi:hypothetical protein